MGPFRIRSHWAERTRRELWEKAGGKVGDAPQFSKTPIVSGPTQKEIRLCSMGSGSQAGSCTHLVCEGTKIAADVGPNRPFSAPWKTREGSPSRPKQFP